MPLPIAVGGVSLSSERLKGPYRAPLDGTNDESKNCESNLVEQFPHQSVTWAVCPRNEWQARTVLSFYDEDIEDNNTHTTTQRLPRQQNKQKRRLMEIRIQISPIVCALSRRAYRETSYHLELFTYENDDDDSGNASDYESDSEASSDNYDDDPYSSESQADDDDHLDNSTWQQETIREPQVVFSQDRRHLMVLVFHNPIHRRKAKHKEELQKLQSSIITFQLRIPRSSTHSSINDRSKIPLPSYLAKATPESSGEGYTAAESNGDRNANLSNPTGGSPAVATHPKFASACEGSTAICRLGGEGKSPNVFLAVQRDGTLNWVNPQSAQIIAKAVLPAIHSNHWFVASMTTSSASTVKKGMVAMVLASSNSNFSTPSDSSQSSDSAASYVSDYDEGNVDGFASSVDSLGSSESGVHPGDGLRAKGGDCVLLEWSCSSLTKHPLHHTLRDDLEKNGRDSQALDASAKEEEDSPRREEHVGEEVQSKPVPLGDGKEEHSGTIISHDELGNSSGTIQIALRSVWSPSSGSSDNDVLMVTDACFGSLSSILCVVYTHTIEGGPSQGPRQKLAQVLTLSDKASSGSNEGYDITPAVSLYLSPDQVEQAPSVSKIEHNKNHDSIEDQGEYGSSDDNYREYETDTEESSDDESQQSRKENSSGKTMESRLVGIQHDPTSDSFVISSIFRGSRGNNDHWVGCVWNWRSNAIGWMIQQELTAPPFSLRNNMANANNGLSWSRLYFGRDAYNGGGSYLVFVDASSRCDDSLGKGYLTDYDNPSHLETRKIFVPAAVLSPANSSNPCVFAERSSLLVAERHVSFPSVVSKDSDATVRELDWKISALPLSYTTSHGSPRIATIGPSQAKSVAVASARGVCVLDTFQHKWKQFGSPNEERSFSVLSMTWWEGSPSGKKDDDRDDLLVAITQTSSGARFLSCWSSKRLDLTSQLMDTPDLEWKPGESQDPEPSWGIPLPKDVRATNISLLSEPEPEQGKPVDHRTSRRAIALVYFPHVATAECDCLVFRLQVFRNKVSSSHSSKPYIARRPYYVMAHKAIEANLNHNNGGPATSAFIASANFQFDLRQSKRKKLVAKIDEVDFVATLGVARSPGGMCAISLFKNGEPCITRLSNFEVSKYQLSDRFLSGVLSSAKRTPIVRFIWTIELLNGNIICWSVPSIVGCQYKNIDTLEVDSSVLEKTNMILPSTKRPKGLDRPSLVFKENNLGENERWVLGTVCEVGSACDWAIQSIFGCQNDISLGQVPQSMFGCVLRCGQNSQKCGRSPIGGIDHQMFSSNILEISSHSQSPFTITPPAFVISQYVLLLEQAFIRMDINAAESSSNIDCLTSRSKIVEGQVHHRLTSVRNTDSSMMALRLLMFRSLEMISKAHKKHSKKPSESTKYNLLLSQSLWSVIIDATRRCTSDLQFASLILEVGRQTEPSNLEHLFPLPMPNKLSEAKVSSGIAEAGSVIELFTICIDKGSLAASASALPLLTSKAQARYYCELLLDEAIANFVRNSSPSQCEFDSTEEERRVLGDFFRFGMKLEDAELFEEKIVAERNEGRTSPDSESVNTIDRSVSNQSFVPDSPENAQRSLICGLTANNSILNYIVPSTLRGESEKQRMEDAIRREASSFIKKSLDDPVLEFAMLPNWDDSVASPTTNRTDTNSVAYLVGDALLELLQNENSKNNWMIIAAFAKMILQEGVEIPSSYDLFVEVADKAQPLDILSIIPESYDVDDELERNLSTYIEEGICSCCREITFSDANYIIDMSLLLIDRIQLLPLVDIGDQTVMEMGLVYIIMVACHFSGRSQLIQDMMEEDSLLSKCYKKATSGINAQGEAEF